MYQDTEIIDRLSRIKLFASFDNEKLSRLVTAPQNSVKIFSEGEYICKEGNVGESMFVILDGIVDVFVRGEHHQREMNIATLHEGDFFGEICVFDEDTQQRTASVKAAAMTTCFELHKDVILDRMQPMPSSSPPPAPSAFTTIDPGRIRLC